MDIRTTNKSESGVRAWFYWAVLPPLVAGLSILTAAHHRNDVALREGMDRLRSDLGRAVENEQELQRLRERVRLQEVDAQRWQALSAELQQALGRVRDMDAVRASASEVAS